MPYFKDTTNCLILLKNIDYYRKIHKFDLRGYCIMPDHLHILIEPSLLKADGVKPSAKRKKRTSKQNSCLADGFIPSAIEYIMHDIKGKSAMDIRRRFNISDKIWQKSFWDFPIYSDKVFEQKLSYIHNNPVRAGLVQNIEDYPWSSFNHNL